MVKINISPKYTKIPVTTPGIIVRSENSALSENTNIRLNIESTMRIVLSMIYLGHIPMQRCESFTLNSVRPTGV